MSPPRGASQPAEEGGQTPGSGAVQPASFTVASFNFGFEQGMMTGKQAATHCANFGRLCAKIVETADADMVCGCEVGAFREGFRRAGINVTEILSKPFGDGIRFSEVDNYLTLWGFRGASQPAELTLCEDSKVYRPPSGRDIDAVISHFEVNKPGHDKFHVVIANMHIVCGKKPPTIQTRKRTVRHLRLHLDGLAKILENLNEAVVVLVVGDDNLTFQEAREAYQRQQNDEKLWEVHATPADLKGDHVAVCGAVARFCSIAVGASFTDRGMRNDAHDAVAVVLTLPGAIQLGESKRRKIVVENVSDADVSVQADAESSVHWDRSPSSTPPLSPTSPGDPDYVEDVVQNRADDLHRELRKLWDDRYDEEYDPKVLHHLSLLLFKKRKSTEPADTDPAGAPQHGSEYDTAFASQEETGRAILSVLKLRHDFLRSKNIDDMRYVLTEPERQELVRVARDQYEQSRQQRALQERDVEKGKARGKSAPQGGHAVPQGPNKGPGGKKGSHGAPQPAGKGGQAKGAGLGSVAKFVKDQKRKRWHRHLQRVAGTKQIWEVLAFSGRFDVDWLTQALQADHSEGRDAAVPEEALRQQRRRLHHQKAEAIARYNEGERLSLYLSAQAGQAKPNFTRRQQDVLQMFESGALLQIRNQAILACGHGRLFRGDGDYLDIGGSTGGGSRRIIDSWQPPDWRDFLQDDQDI